MYNVHVLHTTTFALSTILQYLLLFGTQTKNSHQNTFLVEFLVFRTKKKSCIHICRTHEYHFFPTRLNKQQMTE